MKWILPVSLGALVLTATSTYYAARHQILQDVQKEVDALAQNIAEQIRAFFAQRNNDLATISQSPLFKDFYKNSEYHLIEEAGEYRREIEKMLVDFSKRTAVYPQLRYLDRRGREVCRIFENRVSSERNDTSGTDTFQTIKQLRPGKRYISGLTRVPWHSYPIVQYGIPIFDESGKFSGALVFDCSLSRVYQLLEKSHLGMSGVSSLIDRSAQRNLSPSLQLNRDTLTAYAVIAGTPWTIQMAVDRREFLFGLDTIRNITIIMSLFLAVLMIIIVSNRVRYTTQPIHHLVEVTHTYSQGDLGMRVNIMKPDEVALLGQAFNTMADRLQQRTEDLLQRVKELTALQRMNDAVLQLLGRREIGRACLEAAVTGLEFDRGVLYWVNEDRKEIIGECTYGTAYAGFSDADIRQRRISTSSNDILALVVSTREAINIADATKDPRCNPSYVAETKTKSFCLAPILGKNNRIIGIVGVDNQLTGRPIDQETVRRLSLFCGVAGLALENAQLLEDIVLSETRYRTAVENSPDAVVALDQNMRITLWNRRAEALFGYHPTEARGRTLEFILGPKDYQLLLRQVETAGAVRHAEALGLTRDGRHLDLNISWTGQYAERGSAREWFVVIQDVTDRKRLHSQLIQAEKMSAVGTLIAGVAHELNNPLAAVMGFSEILRDRAEADSEEKEDLRLLRSSALRCRDIVQGLLAFVRQQSTERHRVALNRAVQDTLALLEYRLVKAEAVQLDVDLSADEPAMAGDFPKVQQLLVNLINNACDALQKNKSPGHIRIRTRKYHDHVEVEVEDNGPGIPPAIRQRIFDPFFTTKGPGKGTGLGLSISSQIAAEFGGTLRCEESPEKGARFIASFPLCPPELREAFVQTQLPPPCPGRRVLVVDDEPDIAQLMLRILKEDGAKVKATTSFKEACKHLQIGDFDLVIADVGMGQFRGTDLVEVAQKLKQPPSFLFITGDVLNPSLNQDLSRIKAPLLAKPFLRTEFLRVVRKILSRWHTPLGS